MKKIYLAGPEVFLPNAVKIGKAKKALCKKYGFEGHFPLDNEIDFSKGTKKEIGLLISKENENLIRNCDMIIANITPFRGISADVGTVYEIGFGIGLGKKVYAYTDKGNKYIQRCISDLKLKLSDGGQLLDSNDMTIEDFDLQDNLMIEGGILNNGGFVVNNNFIQEEFLYKNLITFESVLHRISLIKDI